VILADIAGVGQLCGYALLAGLGAGAVVLLAIRWADRRMDD
jgi:hypothetical protein